MESVKTQDGMHAALTREIIAGAMEVHDYFGPGILESSYEKCLCRELTLRGIPCSTQVPLPLEYKGARLDCGYKIDVVVDDKVLLELKAVEQIKPIHEAQTLTYMRLSGLRVGLLMNFNVVRLKDGIKRFVL